MAGHELLRSPAIWRCASCGALVHPADENAPAAWCMRCRRVVPAERDGGDDDGRGGQDVTSGVGVG